jgi:hypothetical protein
MSEKPPATVREPIGTSVTREERANEMRRRAWELVTARGTSGEPDLLEYTNVGITIQYSFFSTTHRLSVRTKACEVLVVEWWNSGKFNLPCARLTPSAYNSNAAIRALAPTKGAGSGNRGWPGYDCSR